PARPHQPGCLRYLDLQAQTRQPCRSGQAAGCRRLRGIALTMYSHLDPNTEFQGRHIGPTQDDQARMLGTIGASSLSELIHDIVPASMLDESPLQVPGPWSESAALAQLKNIAQKNEIFRNYIGQGYYGTHVPNVVLRNILENPAWYTAYTPYQPEISQG